MAMPAAHWTSGSITTAATWPARSSSLARRSARARVATSAADSSRPGQAGIGRGHDVRAHQ